jgi:hypothetical protein
VGKLVFTRHNPGLRRDGAPWADTHIRSRPGPTCAGIMRCGTTKRIVAGESEAWFNPRRALTVAGRSGRCGIGVRRWIEPLADLSRVSVAQGWCRPSRICYRPATVSCWMTSDTPRRSLKRCARDSGRAPVALAGQRLLDRGMGHRFERSLLPGSAVIRQRRPLLPARAHRLWLSANLPSARLAVREGEGHFGIYEHLGEMLDVLTEPDTANSGSTGQLAAKVRA